MRRSLSAPWRVTLAVLLPVTASLLVLTGPAASPAAAAGATQVTSFGTNPGALKMFRYVPAGLPAGAPMVVAMHGCSQAAAAYDEEPGWVALAERWKFVVVLPEQQSGNNSNRCFNWFESGDTARGSGEALSIKQMVDQTKADLGTDPARSYVTGLSAGGAMTSVMLAAYPDVFAGGAVMAGIPYRCATTLSGALSCMDPGVDKTPATWGNLVRGAFSFTGTRPTVQIWHGTSDATVKPLNMTELVDQWTDVAGIDQTPEVQDTVAGYPHKVYRDAAGRNAVESYSLTGMGHGTPIDPGTGSTQCGTAAPYILDVNICSSYYIGKAWGLDIATAPSVNLTAPSSGATVLGAVELTASATAASGVSKVEFFVDGTLLAVDTSAPYAATWDSTAVLDGVHRLMAKAYDPAGNVGSDDDTSVSVANGSTTSTTGSFASRTAEDGYVKANADGTSATVGTLESTYGLAVGRGSDALINKTLLSFDTASVPDGATVTGAYLTLTHASSSGDPWASPAGNTLVLDVQSGCFSGCATEASDWSSAATAASAAQVVKFTSGTQNSSDLSAAGRSAVNRTGLTQIRLRFTSSPTSTAYVFVKNGAGATLHLTWQ